VDGLSSECENGKVEHSIAMGKRQKEKKEDGGRKMRVHN